MNQISSITTDMVSELLVDAYGCEANLSDLISLEVAARAAVSSVGATVAESSHYQFQPHGLTLSLILKESHFIVSTWPEHQLAIVNIFLCNSKMNARNCFDVLAKFLKPSHTVFHTVKHQIVSLEKNKKAKVA